MNPALNEKTFSNLGFNEEKMTISGVLNKSFILWLILAVGAYIGWVNYSIMFPLLIPIVIAAFILALVIIFNKTTSPFLSPIYAFGEGLLLGVITLIFEKEYPGIAFNAILLTISVLFCMLAAFKAGIIRPTNKFYMVVGLSTLAICLLYVIEIILYLFNVPGFTFIHSSGPFGIIFSLIVVMVAALNLIIDFDIIQKGVAVGAPKYMEWYGAFALMVTLVWLYLEIIRLLVKMRE